MILCPNCLHKEIIGALFCSQCGVQLVFEEGIPTSDIRPTTVPTSELEESPPPSSPSLKPAPGGKATVSLHILSSGDILPITESGDISIGRYSDGQPMMPDIDLTPYKAYEAGVSRMHASITIGEDNISITDLGSANGTRINGKKISANVPYTMQHGDMLTLGKFKIQVIFQQK